MTDPRTLPVYKNKQEIIKALEENQVIIVESPTGSGKTTQIPLILKEAGYADKGVIGITQPRRIATLGVCSYIKKQLGLQDNYCAYKMRFYDTTDYGTRIKILTDGMLLQELKADPLLSSYSVIMVDEAHERSLNIDFILGFLKQILSKRKDFKVIVSSATLNTKAFARFFDAKIISIDARIYKVAVKYVPLMKSGDTDEIVHTVCQIINHLLKRFKSNNYSQNEDTLIFLPGEFDIKTCMQDVYSFCDWSRLQIYPLYGRLNKEEQELVFNPTEEGKMKVVLATNIAETSLTIDGIKVVIDSGLAKINYYNQRDFTSSLITRTISRSSCEQRKGRAGRTSEGLCYRLYSQEDFTSRPLYTQEEILRTDLSEVVLRMCDLGIYDFEGFPYITRPDLPAIKSGESTLFRIGAIDDCRQLTQIGQMMVKYPLLPRHARCIVEAINNYPKSIESVIIAISFLSARTPFILPPGEEDLARMAHKRFSSPYGDFISYQDIFNRYVSLPNMDRKQAFCDDNFLDNQSMEEIVHIKEQLCDITREQGIPVLPNTYSLQEKAHNLMVCLSSGLIQYVCMKKKGVVYRTITADEIYIHPGSAWFKDPPQFLLAGEIVQTSKLYARTVSPLLPQWVNEVSSSLLSELKKKSSAKAKEETSKAFNDKTVVLFKKEYPLITSKGKKPKKIAVIPIEDLSILAKGWRSSARHPKNILATLVFEGKFIHYSDKLLDIIRLNGRILWRQGILKTLDVKVLDTNDYSGLDQLLRLAVLPKDEKRLGFVELVSSGSSYFFHVNPNFTEAINNSSYALLSLMDVTNSALVRKAYERIIKLLD